MTRSRSPFSAISLSFIIIAALLFNALSICSHVVELVPSDSRHEYKSVEHFAIGKTDCRIPVAKQQAPNKRTADQETFAKWKRRASTILTQVSQRVETVKMGDLTTTTQKSSPFSSQGKLYFGYGSNLRIQQMHERCPNSIYLGIARLKGYKWLINSRGYANVVEVPTGSNERAKAKVWGVVFWLNAADEVRLDVNEGVPRAYTKEMLRVDFWKHRIEEGKMRINVEDEKPVRKEMLVYIDRKRITDAKPKDEYVVRMNLGIEDALGLGVPAKYVGEVMRRYIPAGGTVDEATLSKARKQALDFRDENE